VGIIQEHDPEADRAATMRISSLSELPAKTKAFNAVAR
jgi:hypothetical protein